MKAALFVFAFALVSVALATKNVGEWKYTGVASPNDVISISVALKIRNAEWLTKTVEEVSDPRHPNWRHFVTKDELKAQIAPTPATVNTVVNFLESKGMLSSNLYPSGDFLMTQWRVADVESLFKVELSQFQHVSRGEIIHRSLQMYTLPEALREYVDVIGMITEFPEGHLQARTSQNKIESKPVTPANDDGSCNAVMNWGYPASSDTDLYSQVQIVCCDGQFTSNVTSPCFGHGDVLIGFSTNVRSNKTGSLVTTEFLEYSDVMEGCSFDGTSITCLINFTPYTQVEPNENYEISISGIFTEGVEGPSSTFPVKLVTSPFVTPQLLWDYYDIPTRFSASFPATTNTQSVAEFGGQYYSPDDLSHFLGNMSLPMLSAITAGSDTNNATMPGDEATLDIEWIMAVATDVDTYFWSVKIGYLLEWAQELLGAQTTPLVNSISYGGNESNSPLSYKNRCDQEFQKLAAIGVSVVVSSGDAGATNVGHGSDSCDQLLPQYPAGSPYVTSVSASFFTPSDVPMCSISYYGKPVHCSDIHIGEIAVSANDGMDWTTGGGFSSYATSPAWQTTAVQGYLSNHADLLPPSSTFNATNRGYPDVTAIGHNLLLILRDKMDIGDGTSASAPIFSGVLSLVNQYLLSVGEAPLGFANPLLYQIAQENPTAFYDVTVGGNNCGDVLHPPYVACCEYGYQSATGWDPVTGLGTPRFESLLSSVQQMVAQQKRIQ